MDVLQRRQIIKYVVVSIVSLFLGIVIDHFLISPYFKLESNQDVEESNNDNQEPVVDSMPKIYGDKTLEIPRACKIHVDVSGALKQPGVFCLEEGSMVIDAITKAGGFTNQVAYRFVARKINLSQVLVNNQKIYIPYEEETDCKLLSFIPQAKEVETIINNTSGIEMPTSEINGSGDETNNGAGGGCININTATLEELDTLSGVGPSMAQKIVEGRPYSNVNDLLNISGIGEATFAKFKDKICI